MKQTIKSTNQLFTGIPSQWVTSRHGGAQWGSDRRSSCHSSPGPPRSTQAVGLISPASSPLGLCIDCSHRQVGWQSNSLILSLTPTGTFCHLTLQQKETCDLGNALTFTYMQLRDEPKAYYEQITISNLALSKRCLSQWQSGAPNAQPTFCDALLRSLMCV